MTVANGVSSTPSSPPGAERDASRDEPQSCGRVLMVRPAAFGYNEETASSNVFQKHPGDAARELRARVWHEFDRAAEALRDRGVEVWVWSDRPEPAKPDAVFPNNWLSTHRDGTLVLYPLEAPIRRRERDPELIAWLVEKTRPRRVLDLSDLENEGAYLEGTGSLVLDRPNRTAYCALSSRSDPGAFARWCAAMGYRGSSFRTDDGHGRPVYHTNVVLSVGSRLAILAEEALPVDEERRRLRESLEGSGRRVLALGLEAMRGFAANALELRGREGPFWVLSTRAWSHLPVEGRRALEHESDVLPLDVTTIEEVGGGGIRCMLAELFLP